MQRSRWGFSWWVMGLAAIACSEQLNNGDGDGVGGDGVGGEEVGAGAGTAGVLPHSSGGAGLGGDGGHAGAPEPSACGGEGGGFGFEAGGNSPMIYGNCIGYREVVCSGQSVRSGYGGDGPCDEVQLDPNGVPQGGGGGDDAGGDACSDYQVDPNWQLGECLDECCRVAEGSREKRVGTCTVGGECCVVLEVQACGI